MTVKKEKIHSIQMLRFVAATLVVFFHSHLALSKTQNIGASETELYLFSFGAVGVHIFFVISGYIMVLTNSGPAGSYSFKRFLKKRLIRIYPIYWLLAAIYVAVNLALGSEYDFTPTSVISALLLLPHHASLIIGPAWTLSYEMFFYLAFGLAMILGMRRGLIVLTAIFLISIADGAMRKPDEPGLALATKSLRIEFLFGVWIGYWTGQRRAPRWLGLTIVALSIALFIVGMAYGFERLPSALIWGVPSALLIFGTVTLEQHGGSQFVKKLSALGESSYTLYLAHILIITIAMIAIKTADLTAIPILIATGIITVGSVMIAHIFHLKVEAPMTRFLNKAVVGPA